MLVSHVSTLNRTFEKTVDWLDELEEIGDFTGQPQAYTALRSVLHAVRDRLTVDEAAHLGAQFPMLIRGFYYEGWRPAVVPIRLRSTNDFLDHVAQGMGNARFDPELACRAVFRLLENRISIGELEDVWHMLPRRVREDLWC